MRLTVYTALTDDRDALREPELLTPGVRYVCFSQIAKPTESWEVLPIPLEAVGEFTDPVRLARWCKVIGYRSLATDYSLWIDATYCPRADMWALVHRHLCGYDIAAFPHFERTCIYDEAKEVTRLHLDDQGLIGRQMELLYAEGYPHDNGLFDTSVLSRRHSPAVARMCDLWWSVIASGSRRDQLSFNYALWKTNLPCNTLQPGVTRRRGLMNRTFQPYFSAVFHKAKYWGGVMPPDEPEPST